jgi:large subunit ribosomal protein L29
MTKKIKELRSLGNEDLKKRLTDLKNELIKLDGQVATGTVPKNPTTIRNSRKTIARILMILHQKDIDERLNKRPEGTKA